MPPVRRGRSVIEERVLGELQSIRTSVAGVQGSLAATIDGLLVAHDLLGGDPAQVAAVVSSTFALASRATVLTGRGEFREAVTRGSEGYLAVYAAGRNAIVAVIGSSSLNVGLLQYQARGVIERVAGYSDEFSKWSVPAQPGMADDGNGRGGDGNGRGVGRDRAGAGGAGSGADGSGAGGAGVVAGARAGAAGALPVRRPSARRGS